MPNVGFITATSSLFVDGGGLESAAGFFAGRAVTIFSVTVHGTSGAGTVHFHNAANATAVGTAFIIRVGTNVPSVTMDMGEKGIRLPSGLRVVQSGTTGGLVTVVAFE